MPARFLAVVWYSAAVMALSGCAGDDDPIVSATPPSTTVWLSPLVALTETSGTTAEQRHDLEQTIVRDCMARVGFTYLPVPLSAVPASVPPPKVGFGLSDPIVDSGDEDAVEADGSLDRNAPYVEGLSMSQRASYMTALNGDGTEEMLDDAGCSGEAFAATSTPRSARELIDRLLDEAQQRFNADPVVVQLRLDERACWNARGYVTDPAQQAMTRFDALVQSGHAVADDPELTSFRSFETAAAVVATECHDVIAPALRQAQVRIESEIISAHPEIVTLLDGSTA